MPLHAPRGHQRRVPALPGPGLHDRAAVVGRPRRVEAGHRPKDPLREVGGPRRREAEFLEGAVPPEEGEEEGEEDGAQQVGRDRGEQGGEDRGGRGRGGGGRHFFFSEDMKVSSPEKTLVATKSSNVSSNND